MEKVKRLTYLGFVLTKRNECTAHIQERARIARATLGQVWGVGERLCRNDSKRRMKLYDAIIGGNLTYRAELWGWRERKETEGVPEKYIRWTLGAKFNTPGYILREETGRKKMYMRTVKRVISYDIKLWKEKQTNSILGECWRNKRPDCNPRREEKEENEKLYTELGWTSDKVIEKIEKGNTLWEEAAEIIMGREIESDRRKLEESKYAEEIKKIVCKEK